MFVGVARLSLQIPDSGSMKSKRQIIRKVTDRVRARFNVAMAEVEDQALWQKATIAVSVVGNEKRQVNEQLDKIIHFVEDMYLAPLISREMEILTFGDQLFSPGSQTEGYDTTMELPFVKGERSLAEAEGMQEWDNRHTPVKAAAASKQGRALTPEDRRAKARTLRNPRDWEKG